MGKETMLCTNEVLKNGDKDFVGGNDQEVAAHPALLSACLEPLELSGAHSQGLNSHFASNTPSKTMSIENKSFCGYIWIL